MGWALVSVRFATLWGMRKRKQIEAQRVSEQRRHLLELLAADAERQIGANAGTHSELGTRASILIASASLAAGLQLAQGAQAGWYLVALIASGLAAVLGVVVILPRSGWEVDLEDLETKSWHEAEVESTRRMLWTRIEVLRRDKRSLAWRAVVLTIGFSALAIALVCAGLQLAHLPAPFDWSI